MVVSNFKQHDESLTKGPSKNQPQTAQIEGSEGTGGRSDSGNGHPNHHFQNVAHQPEYFEAAAQQHQQQYHQLSYSPPSNPSSTIPTIPEGATMRSADPTLATDKSPSPPHSSAPTTGTTTTPTSLGNVSSSGGEPRSASPSKGVEYPEFPRDSLTTQTAAHGAVMQHHPHQGDETWFGVPGADPLAYQHHHHHPGPHEAAMHHHPYGTPPSPRGPQSQPQASSARYNPANYPAAIKLLVSNNVAGSIIGRSGQTISELQKQSSTRIKLSQTGDYYPGTQDRVCLIQGEPGHCKTALRLVLERLHMLQEHQHSQHMAWQLQRQKGATAPSFDFLVRLLVPISSCGMIIGKQGSNIKLMQESTGVSSVRLSPKDAGDGAYPVPAMTPQTSERIVTITGPSLESCLQCVFLILQGMVAHPDISRYANMTTSYSRLGPESYAIGPPSSHALMMPPTSRIPQHPFSSGPSADGLTRRIASSPDLPGTLLSPRMHGVSEPQTPDRLGGFNVPGLVPPAPPFSPLHSAGLPGVSSSQGGLQQPLYLIPQPVGLMEPSPEDSSPHHHVAHSVSAPDLLAFQLEHSMHLGSSPHSTTTPSQTIPPPPLQDFAEGFVPQPPTMIAPGCFHAQVLVPDTMIGSILGRRGSTLAELEMLSGTRIRASQRGDFVPGTRSRVVTVRGQTAQSVNHAQFLMSQRMVLPPTAAYVSSPAAAPTSASGEQQHAAGGDTQQQKSTESSGQQESAS